MTIKLNKKAISAGIICAGLVALSACAHTPTPTKKDPVCAWFFSGVRTAKGVGSTPEGRALNKSYRVDLGFCDDDSVRWRLGAEYTVPVVVPAPLAAPAQSIVPAAPAAKKVTVPAAKKIKAKARKRASVNFTHVKNRK